MRILIFWDELIQVTSQHTLDGTIGGSSPLLGKSAIHEMAKEPRFHRRALSKMMTQAIENFPYPSQRIMRQMTYMSSYYHNKGYVFLQLFDRDLDDKNYDNEYRPKRQLILELACGMAKNKFDYLDTVIGIAIDAPKFSRQNSEDFILLDCTNWSDKEREHYESANTGFGFFESGNVKKVSVSEFPK